MSRTSAICAGAIVALAATVPACSGDATRARVESFSARGTLLPDGSLAVEERWRVRLSPPAVEFRRRVPVWRFDQAFDVAGTFDGAPLSRDTGRARFEIGAGPNLDVRWTAAAVDDGLREFGLAYRLAGAVEISGLRGTLSWRVLPAARGFGIDRATIAVVLPASVSVLDGPWVEEAGWSVARTSEGLAASRARIAAGDVATVGVAFTVDTLAVSEPVWQYQARRARELRPAFMSAGLFLVVVAAGIMLMLRLRFPPWRVAAEGEPPPLPLAMRLAIVRDRVSGDTREIRAALAGRAAQGVHAPPTAWAHERLLGDEAWFSRQPIEPRRLPRAWRRKFRQALLEDLVSAGVVDRDRAAARRDLRRASAATIGLGVVAWAVVGLALPAFGRWPLAVAGGLIAGGVLLAAASRWLSILSHNGARARVLYSARLFDERDSA